MEERREYRLRSVATLAALVLLLAGLALLAGCAATTGPPAAPEAQPYRVGPPDELTVTILPDPVIEREVVVRPDGMISIDLIGDLSAAGRTTEEIAKEIQKRIRRFKRNANVTVALTQSLSAPVTVRGEVRAPNTFALERDTRVVEAIGTVGGPTLFAAKSRIKVIRHQDGRARVYRVNLSAVENGNLRSNILLVGGDIVVVPPTVSATIGYFLHGIFFPLQQILGLGSSGSSSVITGGV